MGNGDDEDPILYRIVDFFELIDMLKRSRLRVPSVSSLVDHNEMIGLHLAALELSHAYARRVQISLDSQLVEHEASKCSVFVSSWTCSRDSIAMWEIYSRNMQAIQIGVRKSSLLRAVNQFYETNSFSLALETPPNDGRVFYYPPARGYCTYVDLAQMVTDVEREIKQRREMTEAAIKNKLSLNDRNELSVDGHVTDTKKVFLYKDLAYQHEQEYRFVLQAVVRSELDYESCREDPFFSLLHPHLRDASANEVENQIYIPFDKAEILEFWCDARLPPWKQNIQIDMLRDFGVEPKISKAYGRALEAPSLKK